MHAEAQELGMKVLPKIKEWGEDYGSYTLIKVLAAVISTLAEMQPNPDEALDDFISLLRKAHARVKNK